ncbi:metalloprotease [Limnoglobus roseus]|uniref:SREBP protease/CBS domain protein n=1 Tax=Limnoglobus roseus TaxID=2598579 RepID=A0A5C1A4C2_9BACT|nr:site-2 protease family protein [Limnoglobus roseus]QEL13951.1 SREBP protease/CBS domain protein [Limnoglobus roseus]
MKTPPPPDRPFDPDDPNFDPWADDPNAPKEPGLSDDDDNDIPWSEPNEDAADENEDHEDTPTPLRVNPTAPVRGPVALLDSQLRGEIEFEILFQQTKAELLRPLPAPSPGESRRIFQLLAVALVLFLLSFLWESVRWIGMAVGVVFLHELGHFLAMRYFGYRDVKMFIVPFFGTVGPRRPETAAGWKRAVTYLMGPLPGLVAAAGLYFAFRPPVEHALFELIRMLLILNAFNLLPVVPLDGGRVLDALFLSRRPWAGTVFRAFTIAMLVVLMIWVETVIAKVVLGLIATFTLLATPLTHRQARSRKVLGGHFSSMPDHLADVPNDMLRELFGVALALANNYDPTRLAVVMRDLHGQAAMRLPSPRVAAVLLSLYLFAWALAAATVTPVAQAELSREEAVRPLLVAFQAATDAEGREPEWTACLNCWRAADPVIREDAFETLERVDLLSPKGVNYLTKLRPIVEK